MSPRRKPPLSQALDGDQPNTQILSAQLKPLRTLLESPSLTELMLNPDGSVWIEKGGRLTPTSIRMSVSHRFSIIRELAGLYDLICNRDSPTLACRLPVIALGRVQAVVPPITDGPMITIRFPARTKLTLRSLVKLATLDQSQADQLTEMVRSRQNIVIAGGTGSGKTTLANALLDLISNERVLIIEDTPEILVRNPNTLYWQTNSTFTARDAVKTALRVRPDRIILGEVRDSAAYEWTRAALTGHPGSLCTVHASSAAGVRQRMTSLMHEAVLTSTEELNELIDSAIDAVVFVSKTVDASKKILRKVETVFVPKQSQKEKLR